MARASTETIQTTDQYLHQLQEAGVHIMITGKPGQREITVSTQGTNATMGQVMKRLAELGYTDYRGMDEEEKTFS